MITKNINKKSEMCFVICFLLMKLFVIVCDATTKCKTVFNSTSDNYPAIIDDIMMIHNSYRDVISTVRLEIPQAAYMLYMEWDEELAKKAQDYAATCPSRKCDDCETEGEFKIIQTFQQRIFNATKIKRATKFKTIIKKNMRIIDKGRLFDESTMKFTKARKVGFWVNILRASAWKVGCGIAYTSIDKKRIRVVYICNYGVLNGSAIDGKLYESGNNSCANCPINTACNETSLFPALCFTKPHKIPEIISITEIINVTDILNVTKIINGTDILNVTDIINVTDILNVTEIINGTDILNVTEIINGTDIINVTEISTPTNLLLKCEWKLDENTEECSFEKIYFGNWSKYQYENDVVQQILLDNNEFSSITFTKSVNLRNGGCFVFEYKQENPVHNVSVTVFGFAIPMHDKDYVVKIKSSEKVTQWKNVSLNLPLEAEDIKVGIAVHTDSDYEQETPTVIMIKNPTVLDGQCSD